VEKGLRILRERDQFGSPEEGQVGKPVAPEVPDRAELMKRLKIKEPSEDFIQSILGEYQGLGEEGGDEPGPAADQMGPPEVPDRTELMKKLKIKEPSEEFIEGILEEYKGPGDTESGRAVNRPDSRDRPWGPGREESPLGQTGGDRAGFSRLLVDFKSCLKEMFGEGLGRRMYELQMRDYRIPRGRASPLEVERFLNSFRYILEGFLGVQNAERAVERLKGELLPEN
jgi:hypothetical protein